MIIKKYESKAMAKGEKERGSWTLFRESFIKKLPKYTTMIVIVPVSYTHLTLPTTERV